MGFDGEGTLRDRRSTGLQRKVFVLASCIPQREMSLRLDENRLQENSAATIARVTYPRRAQWTLQRILSVLSFPV